LYKTCKKCGYEKPHCDFYKRKTSSDGLRDWCIDCEKARNAVYYKNNRKKEIARAKQWQAENFEKVKAFDRKRNKTDKRKEWAKTYRNNNPDKIKEWNIRSYAKLKQSGYLKKYHERWRKKINPEKYKLISRKSYTKKRNTPKGRIDHNFSVALNVAMSGGKRGRSWKKLLGYDVTDLYERLSKTMPDGYTWDDYLAGNLHIDHIVPKTYFKYESTEETSFKACWGLKNLQLLPSEINLKKNCKLIKTGGLYEL
jgi:hypothetical protein